MILVTVGAAVKGLEFDRLIIKMDAIAGRLEEPVLMQIGSSEYRPKNAEYFFYKPFNEMRALFASAKLIVGHCGSGTVLNSLLEEKPLVVVPRLQEFGEGHRDNHQLSLAAWVQATKGVTVVHGIENLEEAVRAALSQKNTSVAEAQRSEANKSLLETIRQFVEGQGVPVTSNKLSQPASFSGRSIQHFNQ